MQATMISSRQEKASPAGAVNANGARKSTDASLDHATVGAQLQAHLEQLPAQARAYTGAQLHPSQLAMAQLAAQEAELQLFERMVADALATLDGRRRALVSERSYRQTMPASACQERAHELLLLCEVIR